MADDRPEAGRYERKFLVEGLHAAAVEHSVRMHPAQFSEVFQRRHVNNCYFDSPGLHFYRGSIGGTSPRLKVRVRWYGNLFGEIARPVLELKGKRGLVGTKRSFPLAPIRIDRLSELPRLGGWLGDADVPGEITVVLGGLRPTLINRYSRRYFVSMDRAFRITLDRDCAFYSTAPPRERCSSELGDDMTTILELKYTEAADRGASRITNALPFRMTKSSKYVTGVVRLGYR